MKEGRDKERNRILRKVKGKKKKNSRPSTTDTSHWDSKAQVISIKQFFGRSSKQVYYMLYVSFYKIIKYMKYK